ncbi:MAG: EAL domain-containing protein, partial [Treponema sp.]|nr:EAL domain-containing protein [Treponema sp.]
SFTSLDFGLFNPDKFFRAFLLTNLLKYSKMMDWATNENSSVKALALYKTDHLGIAVCVRIKYSLTSFMSSVFITIILFFLFIVILCGILGISRVVRFAAEARRLNLLVNTDSITGGFNKEYFITRANKLVRRGKRKYAIVQLRLEKYRNFCITYGLKKGENLLEDINTNISQIIDKKEVLAHVEKSDFALLLFYDSQTSMEKRIKSIMNLLRAKIKPQHLTFSAGVCLAPSSFTDITSLLTYAGLAIPKTLTMQDEIAWFTDSMKEEQIWERQIEDDMKRGISKHEFAVYLQPKYSTKDEKLAAAEALVRWNHPTFGFISPGRFIPIFEKNGFILQLDDYMLTEVAKIQARWISQGKKLVPISVNVSRAHFAEENLAEHICSVVDGYNVPHQFIELELTESAFFDDKSVLLNTIKKLKTYGFKVSMDDFGAGYSSLNSLKELPLDIIKIDAEFFRSVDDTVRSKKIVAQTIMLAKELGMQVVAEGIENRLQVDFLAKMNCDLIQGFYFSKPLPLKEFEERAYPGLGQS